MAFPLTLSVRGNVQAITGDMPADLYFIQACNVAFHDLFTTLQFPASINSLLGLSLKFITSEKFTRGISDIDILKFNRDSKLCMIFANNV